MAAHRLEPGMALGDHAALLGDLALEQVRLRARRASAPGSASPTTALRQRRACRARRRASTATRRVRRSSSGMPKSETSRAPAATAPVTVARNPSGRAARHRRPRDRAAVAEPQSGPRQLMAPLPRVPAAAAASTCRRPAGCRRPAAAPARSRPRAGGSTSHALSRGVAHRRRRAGPSSTCRASAAPMPMKITRQQHEHRHRRPTDARRGPRRVRMRELAQEQAERRRRR